jgi:hypothetical protein
LKKNEERKSLKNKYLYIFHYMLFIPYIVGIVIGIQIGKGCERTNNLYYHHTQKIINLEKKIKEYELLIGKMN